MAQRVEAGAGAGSLFPRVVDGIVYDVARVEDEDEILSLVLSDFCLTEPLNRSQRIAPEEAAAATRLLVRRALSQGVCLKATDGGGGGGGGGRLAAVRLSSVVEKAAAAAAGSGSGNNIHNKDAEDEVIWKLVPERLRPLAAFVTGGASPRAPDIFRKFGVDRYVEFILVNVHVDFRGRRVAQNILNLCYELFRSSGIHVVKVLATNPRTAHIFRKQGFEQVDEYNVLDYMHEGRPYFADVEDLQVAYTFVRDLRKTA